MIGLEAGLRGRGKGEGRVWGMGCVEERGGSKEALADKDSS